MYPDNFICLGKYLKLFKSILICKLSLSHVQLVQQLLSIESTQLDVENSRKINSIISHIKVDVSAGRTPSSYIVPLVHAMIGVLRNRFSALWDPVMDCLAALVESQGVIAWDVLTMYLEKFQELFLLQPVVESISKDDALQDTSAVTEGRMYFASLQFQTCNVLILQF